MRTDHLSKHVEREHSSNRKKKSTCDLDPENYQSIGQSADSLESVNTLPMSNDNQRVDEGCGLESHGMTIKEAELGKSGLEKELFYLW